MMGFPQAPAVESALAASREAQDRRPRTVTGSTDVFMEVNLLSDAADPGSESLHLVKQR
jgi:hypothetical protein